MSIKIGDKVQIKSGAKDVTNGRKANKGYLYCEGGPKVAVVEAIIENWETGGKWGLPKKVTKVRCVSNNIVVWQVQPNDLIVKISNTIKKSNNRNTNSYTTPQRKFIEEDNNEIEIENYDTPQTNTPYAITSGSETWAGGANSYQNTNETNIRFSEINTHNRNTNFDNNEISKVGYKSIRSNLTLDQMKSVGPSVSMDTNVQSLDSSTAWEDINKKQEMLNLKRDIIQNKDMFPYFVGQRSSDLPALYDYQIIIGDKRYNSGPTSNIENKLMSMRAELGLPVHGNNQIAKSMKYYMYNRFKTPDINMAHNKSVTYVFFTRPDLNLLVRKGQTYVANSMVENHTEAAMTWRRHPEIFKLLTDKNHCGDSNNFNLLLSNQVQSFDIIDERLTTANVGRTWDEYEIQYGDSYSGRTAGTFSCSFLETSNYEIINLLKLWITYIDNVSKGAWSPSYNLKGMRNTNPASSHVHTKTLDYASSVYVFKCGPDGEDVLYWSKYYGVFPINTGANSLSWDNNTPIGEDIKLNIEFAYSYKKDLSPISLIEFNNISGVTTTNSNYVSSFNTNTAQSSRPYVGAPYIELDLGNSYLEYDDVSRTNKRSQIRLKFRPEHKRSRKDDILFKSY